jgi:hypothetical protein
MLLKLFFGEQLPTRILIGYVEPLLSGATRAMSVQVLSSQCHRSVLD